MSHSKRAQQRRSKRAKLNKHQRIILNRQHEGDRIGLSNQELKKHRNLIQALMGKKENKPFFE